MRRPCLFPDLAVSLNDPLVGGNLLQGHRATGMEFLRTDANLCPETKLVSIGEGGGHIDIDTGSIHFADKAVGMSLTSVMIHSLWCEL